MPPTWIHAAARILSEADRVEREAHARGDEWGAEVARLARLVGGAIYATQVHLEQREAGALPTRALLLAAAAGAAGGALAGAGTVLVLGALAYLLR